jgi:hypothetical protein
VGSFITRAGGGIDIQLFNRRTLFTFDITPAQTITGTARMSIPPNTMVTFP